MRAVRTPVSVVLTDWAADAANLPNKPEDVLYELLILSLAYDKIYVQDELLTLNEKLADWFGIDAGWNLLKKVLDIGSIVVLKHPVSLYPTEGLRDLANEHPILARAEYIQKFGTKEENTFLPSRTQRVFYGLLDAYLLSSGSSHRYVGELDASFNIMDRFARLMGHLLTHRCYEKWLHSAFPGLTDRIEGDFIDFIYSPSKIVDRMRKRDRDFIAIFDKGTPIFNRSLAYQAASLYTPREAHAMKSLIQSAFAAPFSWREDALGHYSGSLKETVLAPTKIDLNEECSAENSAAAVIDVIDIPAKLPDLNEDFVSAIREVRESDAGRMLRASIAELGTQLQFNNQVSAWRQVADQVATRVKRPKPLNLQVAVIETILGMACGTLASSVIHGRLLSPTLPTIGELLLGGALGVSCAHFYELIRANIGYQDLRIRMEESIKFRCSFVPPIDMAGIDA